MVCIQTVFSRFFLALHFVTIVVTLRRRSCCRVVSCQKGQQKVRETVR
jgi:hypothetical protein